QHTHTHPASHTPGPPRTLWPQPQTSSPFPPLWSAAVGESYTTDFLSTPCPPPQPLPPRHTRQQSRYLSSCRGRLHHQSTQKPGGTARVCVCVCVGECVRAYPLSLSPGERSGVEGRRLPACLAATKRA